jgi:hypothetical protein
MSQHDFSIANQTASSARADLNNGLQALASNSSGTSAPSTTYANQFWYDVTNNLLKIRNEGNSAWINVAYVDQSNNLYKILDDTIVSNTSGTQIGIIGDQSTATWQAGTGTTQSLVSPANVKSVIDSQVSTAPVWVATDSVSTYSATGLSALNTWVKTPINNTLISDLSGAATDTTNYEIDLPAGTYYVEWTLPLARVASDTADKVGVRFRNVTDNVSVGASQQMKIGDWQNLNFQGCGKFTIAGTKSFQLQAWSSEGLTIRYGDVISGDLATFAIIKVYKA